MNKRDAINEILLSLNELPLDVEDSVDDIPTAQIVDKQIDISKRKVLSYGWQFNTNTIPLYPNTDGYIPVPKSYLSIDVPDNSSIIVRDWKLFDKNNLSFIFDNSVTIEAIEDVPFDDIPFHISNYITEMASIQSYINIIGNTEDIQIRYRSLQNAMVETIRNNNNKIKGNALEEQSVSDRLSRTGV